MEDIKVTENPAAKEAPKKLPRGCAFAFLAGIVAVIICLIYLGSDKTDSVPTENKAYIITTTLVKAAYSGSANEISTPFADYKYDYLNDSSYLIVSHFTYKNDFGVEKKFNYKARVKWTGGQWSSPGNWKLIYVEEFPKTQ